VDDAILTDELWTRLEPLIPGTSLSATTVPANAPVDWSRSRSWWRKSAPS